MTSNKKTLGKEAAEHSRGNRGKGRREHQGNRGDGRGRQCAGGCQVLRVMMTSETMTARAEEQQTGLANGTP